MRRQEDTAVTLRVRVRSKSNSSGHRRYTDDDIGWVKFLQLLRATGMPIREAKEFVTLTWAGDHTIPQRVEVLTGYRDATPEDVTGERASVG
jgi:DNA-binding transcriptional MerR regulator